jgi:membrane-bound serine protease (ClpP class)
MAVLPLALAIAGVMTFILRFALKAQRQVVATGSEALVQETGTALTDIAPRGKVFVHGEYWDAVARQPIRQGQRVRICKVDRLLLEVEPIADQGETA